MYCKSVLSMFTNDFNTGKTEGEHKKGWYSASIRRDVYAKIMAVKLHCKKETKQQRTRRRDDKIRESV